MTAYWVILSVLALVVILRLVLKPVESRRHKARRREAERVRDLLSRGGFSTAQGIAYLRKINPYAFEELILDGFEKAGYSVKRNRSYSGDGGVDGRVTRNGEEYLVQCKRYRGHISRQDVEDFSRVCTRERKRGFFVHTGKTGEGSWETAGQFGNVDIVSGRRMLAVAGLFENLNSFEDE